mmetsp:Transcript_5694/g.10226  ORF Transcript_5694/g.10226 Transcript_5694/m.10226 type:complete len:238 (+) Transcript_5694:1051-1764(+)
MNHVRDRVFELGDITSSFVHMFEKLPSFSFVHLNVGYHERSSHLMLQSQMSRCHAITIHLSHKDRFQFKNSRQKIGPMIRNSICISGSHPIGRTCRIDVLGLFHGNLMNRRIRTDNICQIFASSSKPRFSERVVLSGWMSLSNFPQQEFGVFAIISVPDRIWKLGEIVDKGSLHKHVRIHKNDNIIVVRGANISLVSISKSMLQPVLESKRFVPVLGLLKAHSLVRQLFSEFGGKVY